MGDTDRQVPSVAFTRIALIVLVPVAVVFGLNGSVWAAVTLKAWTSGETLTAADLNANLTKLNDELPARVQNATTSANTTTFTASFSNVFPAYTFNAPAARLYTVHIDVDMYFSAVDTGNRGASSWQLVVNGVAHPRTFRLDAFSVQPRWSGSWRAVVMMNAGSNNLQLQAKNDIGTGQVDVNSQRVFTID